MNPESQVVVGRLAPSPTGHQHVGNARTYLLTWLSIRLAQGRLIMRIEDLDGSRVRDHATQHAIDDLHWLGLDWDFGPGGLDDRPASQLVSRLDPRLTDSVPSSALDSYIQSEREPIYRFYFNELKKQGRIYPCVCSRKDIQLASSAPNLGDEGPVYPGTCREATVDTVRPHCWRFRMPDTTAAFEDRVLGPQSCQLQDELGDFIVARKSGEFAYQLAVTIDDHWMGVTEVVRGDDLVLSTFRQQELYRCFNWSVPGFVHVPLVFGSDGRRLAKRHDDIRLSHFREQGTAAEFLIGVLAHSCGLTEKPEPLSANELLAHCRRQGIDLWHTLPREPFRTDGQTWQPN